MAPLGLHRRAKPIFQARALARSLHQRLREPWEPVAVQISPAFHAFPADEWSRRGRAAPLVSNQKAIARKARSRYDGAAGHEHMSSRAGAPTPPISPVERISQGKVSRCPFAQLTSLHDHLSLSTKRSTDFCHHVDEIGSATSCTASPRHQLGYLRTKQSSPTCKPRPTNPYFHPSDPKLPPSPDHELTFHNGVYTPNSPLASHVTSHRV